MKSGILALVCVSVITIGQAQTPACSPRTLWTKDGHCSSVTGTCEDYYVELVPGKFASCTKFGTNCLTTEVCTVACLNLAGNYNYVGTGAKAGESGFRRLTQNGCTGEGFGSSGPKIFDFNVQGSAVSGTYQSESFTGNVDASGTITWSNGYVYHLQAQCVWSKYTNTGVSAYPPHPPGHPYITVDGSDDPYPGQNDARYSGDDVTACVKACDNLGRKCVAFQTYAGGCSFIGHKLRKLDANPNGANVYVKTFHIGQLTGTIPAAQSLDFCADPYELVGNGWCLKVDGTRLNLPGIAWQTTSVGTDGSAASCERQCTTSPACIGYLTEEESKCDIILKTDANADTGINGVDSETRNYCWRKKAVAVAQQSPSQVEASDSEARGAVLTKTTKVKLVTVKTQKRLDMGGAGSSETHDSWATRLYLVNLKNPTDSGAVHAGDEVGLFSDCGGDDTNVNVKRRLDISSRNGAIPTHSSWATKLYLHPQDGSSTVNYFQCLWIYSDDHAAGRLDIGGPSAPADSQSQNARFIIGSA